MEADYSLSFPDQPRADLDRTLGELVRVAGDVLNSQGRLRALLRANQAVVQQLDLPTVLRTIVEVAAELVGAEYGALGVISPTGALEQFIHVGISDHLVDLIGHLPEGHGLLGALIDDPRPIALAHLSDDPRSAGFPDHHPSMESFLGVPITVRDEVYGILYLTNSNNGTFSDADEELANALAATAGFAIDNARLFAESKRARAWAAASAEVTADLLSTEQGDTLSLLVARIRELADADLVFLSLRSEDPAVLTVSIAQGLGAADLEGLTYALEGSVAGTVIEGAQPRLLGEDQLPGGSRPSGIGMGPTMALPLVAGGGVRGALMVSRAPGGHRFTPADLELAADFAGQAGIAIEMADARADKQRMELLEDRGRIARDLHDHVIQQLFATGLQLQALADTLPPGATSSGIEQSITNIDLAIAQIRTAIFALSSSRNEKTDTLRHRIVDLVSEIGSALPEDPRVAFSGPVDLAITGDLADDVLAVIRESLTNTVKHAKATRVSVDVIIDGGFAEVVVRDNGVGLPAGGRRSGLANLERRAAARHGDFFAESTSGETTIRWRAPHAGSEGD
ncbi:MAG TPA: GAF domain-containing protein [Galbitalea sp.]